ncbi:MAG: hypothetical protein VX015_05775 [Planctomycetota bacterium]|jgi:hypothetical protein|nr:hypothetical protein [Planctomycetota bacterium]
MKLPNPSTAMLLPAALVVAGLATAAAPPSGGTAPVARVVDDAAERYEALDEEAGEAISEWSQAWRKAYFAAREAGEQPPARPPSPAIEYGAKFLEAAADYAGTDDAVPFLGWVVTSGVEKAHVTSAVATITASHLGSERLEPIAPTLPRLARTLGDDEAMRFLDALRAENGHPGVKAWATYARHSETLSGGDIDSEDFQTAFAETEALVEAADDETLSRTWRGQVMARIEFAIGKVAPDIEGIDLGGSDFKLSDYEGKVVFLDFWGDW